MSRRLQDLFWDIDLPGSEQLVAQRLAWHANDNDGRCWPGIASLCEKTGLSARTIQAAIKALVVSGHVSREERLGVGVVYTVHPRKSCGGDAPSGDAGDDPGAVEPPQELHPRSNCTPAKSASTPAESAPKQVRNREDTDMGSARDARSPEERITGQVGRRIEPGWQPMLELPDGIAKVVAGWPPGRLAEVLDEFRDYWLAEAGKIASKRDWDRTWWNRLRAVIARDVERKERRHGTRRGGDRGRQGYRDPLLERELTAAGGDP